MTLKETGNSISDRNVVMFAGKGGVGKTTCAAATALNFAVNGNKTLVLSTDPTPSLRHIFNMREQQKPVKIAGSLYLDEIGVEQVKQMWDGKFGREVYEVFSSFVDLEYEEFVEFVSAVLPGMRDEFMVDYIREMVLRNEYQKVVWDTAPLGQTLGLLDTPSMLAKHLRTAPRIYTRLKLGGESKRSVLDIIKGWEELSAKDTDFLRNEVGFVMVTIPEALAVEQLYDIFGEFARHGLKIECLVINNVIEDITSDFLLTKSRQQNMYISMLYERCHDLNIVKLPMFPYEIKGLERIKQIRERLFGDVVQP